MFTMVRAILIIGGIAYFSPLHPPAEPEVAIVPPPAPSAASVAGAWMALPEGARREAAALLARDAAGAARAAGEALLAGEPLRRSLGEAEEDARRVPVRRIY